ncbi:MAG TPA: sterol desaturase family protein [Myxococcales bacterium LLY-WYZ-16_1]|nr:sterol desaturase family protein [Myxococcales bacterium LLY-WYZ-16_1]
MSPFEVFGAAIIGGAVACGMEPWSRFVHRRFWHGPLYGVHRSHHPRPGEETKRLEANDGFALAHALLAVGALYASAWVSTGVGAVAALGLGCGLCAYGLAHLIVHDGLAHGRLPVRFLLRWRYFRRVRAAHEIHHRRGGPPFGLFLGPKELQRSRKDHPIRGS